MADHETYRIVVEPCENGFLVSVHGKPAGEIARWIACTATDAGRIVSSQLRSIPDPDFREVGEQQDG